MSQVLFVIAFEYHGHYNVSDSGVLKEMVKKGRALESDSRWTGVGGEYTGSADGKDRRNKLCKFRWRENCFKE